MRNPISKTWPIAGVFAALALLSLDSARVIAVTAGSEVTDVRNCAFAAVRALDLRHFKGRLKVDPHDEDRVDLEIEGPARLVESLEAEVADGRLVVIGPVIDLVEDRGSQVSNLVVREGTVTINSLPSSQEPPPPQLDLRIAVPEGLPIRIDRMVGSGEIGDIKGPIAVDLSAGRLRLGQVGDARPEISGSGDISAATVIGDLTARVMGSGTVDVEDGVVSDLLAEVSGAGSLWLGGRAERATLALTGAGSLHVEQVVQRPDIDLTGAGRVSVGNW